MPVKGHEGKRVGAKKHFAGMVAFAKSYRKRRAVAGTDQKILLAIEDQGERESPPEARQARSHGLDRRQAAAHGLAHEMGDDLGIGLGRKFMALCLQFAAQLPEILDNAIMHDADIRADMRMRVIFAWPSMGCPASVADADPARKRFGGETKLQIIELAARPRPGQPARFQRRDAGGIIAAVFEALQRIEKGASDRAPAEHRNNSAH